MMLGFGAAPGKAKAEPLLGESILDDASHGSVGRMPEPARIVIDPKRITLQFCMWLQENFDRLIVEVGVKDDTR